MTLLVSAKFSDAPYSVQLPSGAAPAQVLSVLQNTQALLQKKVYDYAPLDMPGLSKLAGSHSASISNIAQLALALKPLKPSALEALLTPFVREDRSPEFLLLKKADPAVNIALCAYLKAYYERLYPPAAFKPAGTASKNEFRFAAQLPNWTVVRKVNFDVAEKKEAFTSLVACLEGVSRKVAELSSTDAAGDSAKLNAFLAQFPQRRSLSRLYEMVSAMASQGVLNSVSAPFRAYFLSRVFAHAGFPPYGSIEVCNGVYPELKIPKPRGRMKKA